MAKERTIGRILAGAAFCLGLAAACATYAATTVEVSAPDRDYLDCPVTVELPRAVGAKVVTLTDTTSNARLLGQVWKDGRKLMLTFILPELKKGGKVSFRLDPVDQAKAPPPAVDIRTGEEAAEILIDRTLFTRYVISDGPKPYCYPVIGPTGAPVRPQDRFRKFRSSR